MNDAWLEESDPRLNAEPVDYGAWWQSLEDPALNDLVERATRQNLSLQIAGLRVLEAMAARGIAVGEFFPQTQVVGGSFTRTMLSENTSDLPPPTRYFNEYGLGFDAAWELDFWGRFRRQIESADALLEATVADYDAVMVALVAEVASTYVQIRTIEAQLAAARSNIAYQEQGVQLSQAKFDAGSTSELDVAFSRAILGETQASVPSLESQLAQARNRLAFLLGTTPRDLSTLVAGGGIPDPPLAVAVGLPADLLRRRPDVRSAERIAAAQCAQIGVAEADFYPAISIVGSIGLSSEHSNDLLEKDSGTGTIGPSVSLPFLNYGRIENNVRVQAAVFQELIVSYRNTVLLAASEVEDALVAFLRSQEEVQYLTAADAAAELAVELALLQYREGTASFAPVLLALEFQVGIANDLAVARGSVVLNLIAAYKALGGGWEVRSGLELLAPETEAELRELDDWGDLLSPEYSEGRDLLFPRPNLDVED